MENPKRQIVVENNECSRYSMGHIAQGTKILEPLARIGILAKKKQLIQRPSRLLYFLGQLDLPIKYVSIWWAASRPSEIAQTIKDWPLRQSPATKIFFFSVWYWSFPAMFPLWSKANQIAREGIFLDP